MSRRDFETEKFNFIKCDVCKQEEVKRVFESIFQKEGQIDVLINNAGMGISGAIEYAPKKDVEAIFDVNVNAVINVSGEALKYLRKTQGENNQRFVCGKRCAYSFSGVLQRDKSRG